MNDAENEIIIFTCISNLQCLCDISEIIMDGTFRCCPNFFKQLYTIHGHKDGNYIPLVFMFLPGKSEEIYHTCISALIKLCSEKNLQFQPNVVHIDFEKMVITVISQLLPDSTIKCCRFHLAYTWWRQIQKVGLSSEYKDPESEIGRWLKSMFGIAYLSPDEVEDSFVEDYMSVAPGDEKSTMFADYLTNTYMTQESLFPPSLWAEVPSDSKRTTNDRNLSMHILMVSFIAVIRLSIYFWF